MDIIDKLETWRTNNSHTKAHMARIFGVPEQNYNNWVYRGSLPKSQYTIAQNLLSENEISEPKAHYASGPQSALSERLKKLPADKQQKAMKAIIAVLELLED